MTPYFLKRGLPVIIGFILVAALSVLFPPAAPIGIAAVLVLVIIAIWTKSHKATASMPREHREPTLWDDGFGAT